MSSAEQATDRWIHEARQALQNADRNFFAVKPWRYWADFLLSLVLAYGAAGVFLTAPTFSWQQMVAFPIAVFWLYRLGSLVHEVAHLGHHEMRAFKVAWNLLVGVVTLSPSPFFTRHHRDHHSARLYGTPEDPEYVRNFFWKHGAWAILAFAGEILLLPAVVFFRFLLSPLTFIHPKVRQFMLRRLSSLTLNWRYERTLTPFDVRVITAVELLCCVRAAFIPATVLLGVNDWSRIPLLYVLAVSVLVLNQMRLLADHHLESDGQPLSMHDHILDSCNFVGRDALVWLFFPFAIRYHALHHLFPSLPYHNLKAAHAYLSQQLSPDSPYHELERTSWWAVAREAFRPRTAEGDATVAAAQAA